MALPIKNSDKFVIDSSDEESIYDNPAVEIASSLETNSSQVKLNLRNPSSNIEDDSLPNSLTETSSKILELSPVILSRKRPFSVPCNPKPKPNIADIVEESDSSDDEPEIEDFNEVHVGNWQHESREPSLLKEEDVFPLKSMFSAFKSAIIQRGEGAGCIDENLFATHARKRKRSLGILTTQLYRLLRENRSNSISTTTGSRSIASSLADTFDVTIAFEESYQCHLKPEVMFCPAVFVSPLDNKFLAMDCSSDCPEVPFGKHVILILRADVYKLLQNSMAKYQTHTFRVFQPWELVYHEHRMVAVSEPASQKTEQPIPVISASFIHAL